MTTPRCRQLCLNLTPFYHCVTRCVRRAFLCGRDPLTKKCFDHRRLWLEKHLLLLSDAFCIDMAGYAIMSNHYHVVLHVDNKLANSLTDQQVIERWHKLYKGPELIRQYCNNDPLSDIQLCEVKETIQRWRKELTNISRFMGHLNEHIARRANKEDNCKGRFWESRFKLQAILDIKALLRTLCYVDLNPIRAKAAKTPESSRFTSIKRRIDSVANGLMPFASKGVFRAVHSSSHKPLESETLPITFNDYLKLLDYTARVIKKGSRGFVANKVPAILTRLGYSEKTWRRSHTERPQHMYKAVGDAEAIAEYCDEMGQSWIWQHST